jgi:hypothetical protein
MCHKKCSELVFTVLEVLVRTLANIYELNVRKFTDKEKAVRLKPTVTHRLLTKQSREGGVA